MRIATLFLMLFIWAGSFAREATAKKDAAIWVNVYLEKKLNKKLIIHLNQQNRWVNNASDFGVWYADVGITYKINKNFKLLTDYVFAQKQKYDRWSNRHQFYIALYSKKRHGRWSLTNRSMLQNAYADILTSENGMVPAVYYRNKVTVKHELNKYFSYYAAQELYLPLNHYRQRNFDRSRTFTGMFYALSKSAEMELYLLFQNELNPLKRRKQDYVMGLGFSKSF